MCLRVSRCMQVFFVHAQSSESRFDGLYQYRFEQGHPWRSNISSQLDWPTRDTGVLYEGVSFRMCRCKSVCVFLAMTYKDNERHVIVGSKSVHFHKSTYKKHKQKRLTGCKAIYLYFSTSVQANNWGVFLLIFNCRKHVLKTFRSKTKVKCVVRGQVWYNQCWKWSTFNREMLFWKFNCFIQKKWSQWKKLSSRSVE